MVVVVLNIRDGCVAGADDLADGDVVSVRACFGTYISRDHHSRDL
jgi:hypothetical protein